MGLGYAMSSLTTLYNVPEHRVAELRGRKGAGCGRSQRRAVARMVVGMGRAAVRPRPRTRTSESTTSG